MTTEIQHQLTRLESQHNIQILYAVESGSRAWGLASVNSDWDVRYIYVHRPEWYLQIDDKKDSQEEILPNDLDLAGWELRKVLRPILACDWIRTTDTLAEIWNANVTV